MNRTQIPDGRYTVVYPGGQYRTLRFKSPKDGKFFGKTIVSFKEGTQYTGFGFLVNDNKIIFWRSFLANNPEERIARIQKAVYAIADDPSKAGMQYALKENACYRCGRELTVPASIHNGMGPECAKKNWRKEDQLRAYEHAKSISKRQPTPAAAPSETLIQQVETWLKEYAKTHGPVVEAPALSSALAVQVSYRFSIPLSVAERLLSIVKDRTEKKSDEWIEMKNEFAKHEAEQEREAFMSDPDLFPEKRGA